RVAGDVEVLRLAGSGVGTGVLLSKDGRFLAAASADHSVLWSLDNGKASVVVKYPSHTPIAFSPDSGRFAMGNAVGTIGVAELPCGKLLKRLAAGPRPAGFAFHAREEKLAVFYNSGLAIRDLETGHVLRQFFYPWDPFPNGAWHPDGKIVAAVG